MKKDRITYRDFISDDCCLLPALVQTVWKIRATAEYFQWKYQLPPFESTGWVVDGEKGELASFTGYWARKTKTGSSEILPAMLADVMAVAEYRGGSVYPLIAEQIRKMLEKRIVFGFTNPISHKLFKKTMHDYILIDENIPVFTFVINAGILAGQNRSIAKIVGPVSRMIHKIRLQAAKQKNIMVNHVESIDDDFQRLWENVKDEYYGIQYRGRDYLQWRFISSPHRKYQIWKAKRGDSIAGYIVTTIKDEPGRKGGFIVDWLVSRKDEKVFTEMIRVSLLWMISQKVDIVETWILNHEKKWIKILKYLFFMRNKRTQTFLLGGNPGDIESREFRPDNFFFTMGDSDYLCI